MRIASLGLFVPLLLACRYAPPTRSPTPPREPWERLDRTCARDDNPRHLERRHVERERPRRPGDTRELLVVPVTIDPKLVVPRAWIVSGKEEPDIEPFRWRLLRLASPGESHRTTMGAFIRHVSRDRLILGFGESIPVNTWVIHVDIERRSGGALVATLSADSYDDMSLGPGHWSDLAGEVKLSADSWQGPNASLSVHLEISHRNYTTCEQFRIVVPAPGEERSILFPSRGYGLPRPPRA